MLISATYICPIRGLTGLAPAEPFQLEQASKVAGSMRLKRLIIPVQEESLLQTVGNKVRFLDGLVQNLDRVENAGLTVWLIAPAQRILGLDWIPPYLAKGHVDPKALPVFVDGKLRNLGPFNWWADPSIVQKRIRLFREVVSAVGGHPALTGWIVMDRALEWPRPRFQDADLLLRSYCAEIKERDEAGIVYLSLGSSGFLDPEMARYLAGQVDGVHIRGVDSEIEGLEKPSDLSKEIFFSAYMGALAKWLFSAEVQVEIGWRGLTNMGDPEEVLDAIGLLGGHGIEKINWLSLMDPEKILCSGPPWSLRAGLERIGLIDRTMEPKRDIESWLQEIHSLKPRRRTDDFIDMDVKEYLADPYTHFHRLWGHFRESI